jgi:hypothetical protein
LFSVACMVMFACQCFDAFANNVFIWGLSCCCFFVRVVVFCSFI